MPVIQTLAKPSDLAIAWVRVGSQQGFVGRCSEDLWALFTRMHCAALQYSDQSQAGAPSVRAEGTSPISLLLEYLQGSEGSTTYQSCSHGTALCVLIFIVQQHLGGCCAILTLSWKAIIFQSEIMHMWKNRSLLWEGNIHGTMLSATDVAACTNIPLALECSWSYEKIGSAEWKSQTSDLQRKYAFWS